MYIGYKKMDGKCTRYTYREVSDEIFHKFENLCIYGVIKAHPLEITDIVLYVVSRETFKFFFHLVDNNIDF